MAEIRNLWDGEPWVVPSTCSQEIRGLYRKAKLSLTPVGTSTPHNMVHAKVPNVVQEECMLKKSTNQPNKKKQTQSPVELPLLLGTGLGSGSFTAPQAQTQPCPMLHAVSPMLAWSPGCGSEHNQNHQYDKHRNKSLDCPAMCVPLPVTAAELPDCNSLPKAPRCPLPKPTLLGLIGQRLLDGKAKVLPAALKSTKWKENLCLQAEQLRLMKYSMQKPLPFFSWSLMTLCTCSWQLTKAPWFISLKNSPLLLVPQITWIAHTEMYSLWKKGYYAILFWVWSSCMHKIQWEIHHWLQTEQNGAFTAGFSEWLFCVTTLYPDAPVQLHIGINRLP